MKLVKEAFKVGKLLVGIGVAAAHIHDKVYVALRDVELGKAFGQRVSGAGEYLGMDMMTFQEFYHLYKVGIEKRLAAEQAEQEP